MNHEAGPVIRLYLAHFLSSTVFVKGGPVTEHDSAMMHMVLTRQVSSEEKSQYQLFPLTVEYPAMGSLETCVRCPLCGKEVVIRTTGRYGVLVRRVLGMIGLGYALMHLIATYKACNEPILPSWTTRSDWLSAAQVLFFLLCLIGGGYWAFANKVDQGLAVRIQKGGEGHDLFSTWKVRFNAAETAREDAGPYSRGDWLK